jgi:Fur family transcriptional regulator, peroxide stress response regulator
MNGNGGNDASLILAKKLEAKGWMLTARRALVFEVVSSLSNHPTAEEVFARARERMPSISLATVYNCLEVLRECGAICSVREDGQGARYCASGNAHAHLHLPDGRIVDVPLSDENVQFIRALVPQDYDVGGFDLNFTGESKRKNSSGGL